MCALQCYVIVFTQNFAVFPVEEGFLCCHTVQDFFFPPPKKQTKNQQYWHLLSPLCTPVCVFVCLLSGHPSWVFLLQCFFQLTNSRFPSMGLMDWHIQASCPHSHARPHTSTQKETTIIAFQLCVTGRPTDGTLSWWSTVVYRNNLSKWTSVVFWAPHNYLVVAAVVKRLSSKLAQC